MRHVIVQASLGGALLRDIDDQGSNPYVHRMNSLCFFAEQQTHDRIITLLSRERVLAPRLLNISRTPPRLAE